MDVRIDNYQIPEIMDSEIFFAGDWVDENACYTLTNGKFNPMTRGHDAIILNAFEMAHRKRLEGCQNNHVFVFTPPKDAYVTGSKKFSNNAKKVVLCDYDRVMFLAELCRNINMRHFSESPITFSIVPLNLYTLNSVFKNLNVQKSLGSNRNKTSGMPRQNMKKGQEEQFIDIIDDIYEKTGKVPVEYASSSLVRYAINHEREDLAKQLLSDYIDASKKNFILKCYKERKALHSTLQKSKPMKSKSKKVSRTGTKSRTKKGSKKLQSIKNSLK